ncbi:two-component system, chemotaxis family, sensor kinase CheA [Natronorubrum sediminis]|uniref:Chemotaxis protein CheA n=1 Tax=Natronorubrum sediminis TaxID=640943 RepID=A0A1H6FQU4_9EURY|nr:chemotaxis protein CheA [Natronorubrum sediminis]SEH12223.1 two-component system, chemotaxis family, sensor kinase CheA [Natronorubrum sediminis]
MSDYLTDFVQESEERITELNNALLTLERDPTNDDALENIFRVAHTLKGNCGAMGLEEGSDLAHAIEDLLDAVRRNELEVTSELMDVVFDAVDELEAMIDEVAATGEIETDPTATIDRLRASLDDESTSSALAIPSAREIETVLERFEPPANDDHDAYFVRLDIAARENVNNGVLVVKALIDAFDLIGTDPPRAEIEAGNYGGQFDAVFGSAVGEAAITSGLEPVEEVDTFQLINVTEQFDRVASSQAADADGQAPADQPGTGMSSEEAQDLEVDELLDEFDEFDNLDEMVEDVDDDGLDAFDEMGEAGSFDELLDDEELEETEQPATAADDGDERQTAETATDSSPDDDGDESVDDASSVFNELKDEVEMVGFDELQDELSELEFDEFDNDDEVDMDELLGDDVDPEDDTFLDGTSDDELTEDALEDAVDDVLVDEPIEEGGSDDGETTEPVNGETVDDETSGDTDVIDDELEALEDDSSNDEPSVSPAPSESATPFSDEQAGTAPAGDHSDELENADAVSGDLSPDEGDEHSLDTASDSMTADSANETDSESDEERQFASGEEFDAPDRAFDEPADEDEGTADGIVTPVDSLEQRNTDEETLDDGEAATDDREATIDDSEGAADDLEETDESVEETAVGTEESDGDEYAFETAETDDGEQPAVGDDTDSDPESTPAFDNSDATTADAPLESDSSDHSDEESASSATDDTTLFEMDGAVRDEPVVDEALEAADNEKDETPTPSDDSEPDFEALESEATTEIDDGSGETEPIDDGEQLPFESAEKCSDGQTDEVSEEGDEQPVGDSIAGSTDEFVSERTNGTDRVADDTDEMSANVADDTDVVTADSDAPTADATDVADDGNDGDEDAAIDDSSETADVVETSTASPDSETPSDSGFDVAEDPDDAGESAETVTESAETVTESDETADDSPSTSSINEESTAETSTDDSSVVSFSEDRDGGSDDDASDDSFAEEAASDDPFGDKAASDDSFAEEAASDDPFGDKAASDDSFVDDSLEDDPFAEDERTADPFDDDSFDDDSFADDPFADDSLEDDPFEASSSFDDDDTFSDEFGDDLEVGASGFDAPSSSSTDGASTTSSPDPAAGDSSTTDSGETVVERVEEPVFEVPDLTIPDAGDRSDVGTETDEIQSVRVDVEQIDSLLTLVEGLVTSRVRLRHAVSEGEEKASLETELDDLEDLTADLQETVMNVRLVPLQTVTNRLPRVVRDIAREQDKQVTFEMNGEDVELDRSILDRIGDPLIHLVRNAVDHGIEPPTVREDAEKPADGTVEVHAERKRDRVAITVEDDGSGLDPDRLRNEAVEAGVLSEEDARELPDDDVYELIFHAGLSTAEEVTDVSGRGVGMDVVERTIEDLDGTVDIDSEPGAGTSVTMTLPVSVAIDDILFLECGGEEFGIPTETVLDIEPATRLETRDDATVLVDGNDEYDVVRLDETLETPHQAGDDHGMVVRIRTDVRPIAIHCDHVHGQQEVVVKPFEGFMSGLPGLSGATVRGRGEVVNILDVTTL